MTEKRVTLTETVGFYVANKCSFSGLTESSSFSKQASNSNFSMRGIEKLKFYSYAIHVDYHQLRLCCIARR